MFRRGENYPSHQKDKYQDKLELSTHSGSVQGEWKENECGDQNCTKKLPTTWTHQLFL